MCAVCRCCASPYLDPGCACAQGTCWVWSSRSGVTRPPLSTQVARVATSGQPLRTSPARVDALGASTKLHAAERVAGVLQEPDGNAVQQTSATGAALLVPVLDPAPGAQRLVAASAATMAVVELAGKAGGYAFDFVDEYLLAALARTFAYTLVLARCSSLLDSTCRQYTVFGSRNSM